MYIKREDAIKAVRSTVAQYVPFLNGINMTLPLECETALRSVPSADRPQVSAELRADFLKRQYEAVLDENKRLKADRPQGEWIYRTDVGWHAVRQCSLCGWMQSYSDTKYMGYRYNYCPHCGCRMKGADDETN